MSSRQYEIGYQFEVTCKEWLENKMGYFVIRSSGSHSPFDLVGMRLDVEKPETILVQCRVNGNLKKGEKELLTGFAKRTKDCALLAYKDKNNRNRVAFSIIYDPEVGAHAIDE